MFWYRWPSLVTELLSGILCASAAQVLPGLTLQLLAATALSATYEAYVDKNGWSWLDLGQRSLGIVVGLVGWTVIR